MILIHIKSFHDILEYNVLSKPNFYLNFILIDMTPLKDLALDLQEEITD